MHMHKACHAAVPHWGVDIETGLPNDPLVVSTRSVFFSPKGELAMSRDIYLSPTLGACSWHLETEPRGTIHYSSVSRTAPHSENTFWPRECTSLLRTNQIITEHRTLMLETHIAKTS